MEVVRISAGASSAGKWFLREEGRHPIWTKPYRWMCYAAETYMIAWIGPDQPFIVDSLYCMITLALLIDVHLISVKGGITCKLVLCRHHCHRDQERSNEEAGFTSPKLPLSPPPGLVSPNSPFPPHQGLTQTPCPQY